MSCLSTGPVENRSGLIISGFMGRVELGSMTGSQFAAGRSYHGEEASPCIVGMMNGASLADLVLMFVKPSVELPKGAAES
jgi:hypothetical protein